MIGLIVFFGAMATAVWLVPLAKRLSFKFGIVALPGGRRLHHGRIPKLGGLPVVAGYAVGILLTYWLLPPEMTNDGKRLQGVILGTAVMLIGGWLDDRYDFHPRWQFAFQFLAAGIAISHTIFIERFTNPLPNPAIWDLAPLRLFFDYDPLTNLVIIWPPLVFVLTLLWLVGMINAVNWLDGLDGLAAGVGAIAALLFAWHGARLEQTTVPLFPLALAGTLIGFLFFNFSPASIFLGTIGAWVLGYNLATLSILSPAKLSTALLVMALPILDGVWLVYDRLRRGRRPFDGDRGHLHFRLVDSGIHGRWIVLAYYGIALTFGLVAILVPDRLLKIGIWLLLGTAVSVFWLWFSRRPHQLPAQNKP